MTLSAGAFNNPTKEQQRAFAEGEEEDEEDEEATCDAEWPY